MLCAQTLHNTGLVNNSYYKNLNSEFQWWWGGGVGCCQVMGFGFVLIFFFPLSETYDNANIIVM